jgi:hypothetical protein
LLLLAARCLSCTPKWCAHALALPFFSRKRVWLAMANHKSRPRMGRRLKVSRISLTTVTPSPFPEVLRFVSLASHILLTGRRWARSTFSEEAHGKVVRRERVSLMLSCFFRGSLHTHVAWQPRATAYRQARITRGTLQIYQPTRNIVNHCFLHLRAKHGWSVAGAGRLPKTATNLYTD